MVNSSVVLLVQVVRTMEGSHVLVVTSTGQAYSIKAAAIPPPMRSGTGTAITQVCGEMWDGPVIMLVQGVACHS